MDESHKPNLEEYEALFSQQVAKPSSSIYNHHTTKNTKECPYTAKEVIENVKRSLRAIHNADYVITDRNVKKRLQPYKQSSLLPLNLLSVPREVRFISYFCNAAIKEALFLFYNYNIT